LTLADWEPRVTPSQLSTYSRKKSHFEHVFQHVWISAIFHGFQVIFQ
jgi:hypothetical protein